MMQTLVLKGERPISWNKMYAGMHWSKRAAEADRVHALVKASGQHLEMCEYPVEIDISVYFDKRPMDCDNICSKLYIDGLIGLVIGDDSPKFVESVTVRSMIDRDNPRIVVSIFEIRRVIA